ncbi:MAG: hypothetical protein GC136_09480 [Alphaproteobacteria bacterium]|nr:hypothetical protein [Alphaproteobacteria bacterium]
MTTTLKRSYAGGLYGANAALCLLQIAMCTEYGRKRNFDIRVLAFICGCIRTKSNSASCSLTWIAKTLNVARSQVSRASHRLIANGFITAQEDYSTLARRKANIYTLNTYLIETYKNNPDQYAKDLTSDLTP